MHFTDMFLRQDVSQDVLRTQAYLWGVMEFGALTYCMLWLAKHLQSNYARNKFECCSSSGRWGQDELSYLSDSAPWARSPPQHNKQFSFTQFLSEFSDWHAWCHGFWGMKCLIRNRQNYSHLTKSVCGGEQIFWVGLFLKKTGVFF